MIEYLAVRKLNPTAPGTILCFIGPPGVGKTSLGQSIADALGRKFARISLGGIRDEAEIRGHRRTYFGSMPGRIIQELRRVGSNNPVLMLTKSISSAWISGVIPQARYWKYWIRRYLIKRQLAENGLKPEQCLWEDSAIEIIITNYTHEAGVRELERQIGAICRTVAAQVARGQSGNQKVTTSIVSEMLGPATYVRTTQLTGGVPGVVNGLAYTPMGGEVMQIEAARFPGKNGITLTGQLGDVMRESAQAALTLLRTRANQLGIDPSLFAETQVHIHVPAGAVPKDGPSAGVAMFVALSSLFMDVAVPADLAMTGEITLRGLVLPIGGLKEKSLAAMRVGISRILIPKLNEKDLRDIPEEVQEKIHFLPVATIDEVLKIALPTVG